jgi:DNA-binding CsgD family transcriptional regulator
VRELRAGAPDWPLVGRQQQLELTRRALRERSGVVIYGAAGVGKTRLAREVLARAEAEGDAVERVAATHAGASMPFGAYAHLLPSSSFGYANRAQLLAATMRELKQQAAARRLIVGVDDAHLLDPGSAALTLGLQSSGTALVLVTLRRGEPCPDAVTGLWKERHAVRIDLEPLSRGDVASMLEAALDGSVERRTVDWFSAHSGGNPLFLRELVDGARARADLAFRDGLWQLVATPRPSARLVDLVETRFAGLGLQERRVVELLALAEPLAVEVLALLTTDRTLQAMERQRLVSVQGGEARLAHPIYGEVVAARLGAVPTRSLLSELAQAVEQRSPMDGAGALRIAVWRLQSGTTAEPAMLISAAREANRVFDHELAARLASEALTAGGGAPATLQLATAHARRNHFQEAEETLAPWEANLAAQPEAFDFLMLRVMNLHAGLGRTSEATAQLDRAARWHRGPWQDQVEALRVLLLFDEGRLGAAAALGRSLVAGGMGDARALQLAGGPTSLALLLTGATREAEELANDLIAQDLASGSAEARWSPIQAWVAARLRSGRGWDALEPRIAALHADAAASGDEVLAGLAEMTLGRIALTKGRLDDAVRWLREAAVHLEESDPRRALVACLATLATAHALRGELRPAEAARARADAVAASHPSRWLGLIEVAISDIWLAAGRGELTRARRDARQWATGCGEAILDEALFLHVAMRVGEPAGAVAASLRVIAEATDADLVHAYAAHAAALSAGSGAELEEISVRFEEIGAGLLALEAAIEAAQVHRRAGRASSSRRAALRAERLVQRCPGARLPAMTTGGVAPLTPREYEVAALAANGLSNAEIAARLMLSVRSVESHLYRAMSKLDIHSRHDLPLGG